MALPSALNAACTTNYHVFISQGQHLRLQATYDKCIPAGTAAHLQPTFQARSHSSQAAAYLTKEGQQQLRQ